MVLDNFLLLHEHIGDERLKNNLKQVTKDGKIVLMFNSNNVHM